MNRKTKIILFAPLIVFYNWRARRIAKKIKKEEGEERYPLQWRNDYTLKRAKTFLKIYNIKLVVEGFENIPKAPAIITPNHASSMDPILILVALENKDKSPESSNLMPMFLGKKELLKHKGLRGWSSILNTHFINRDNLRESLKTLDKFDAESKRDKKYQVIFPEGKRSLDGEIKEFKGGAFRNAKKSFLPIIPVTINNSLSATDSKRVGKQTIKVIFHPQIKPINIVSQENKNIAENVRKIIQSKWEKSEGKRSFKEEKV